jgi:multiple sugar transport system ATP-binding protein
MADPTDIRLENLVKKYDETTVLEGIDLDIRAGEFLVLVGPSGCGKSTLLRCIAGLEEITSGDLFIDDQRCNNVHPKDRDLAMVFQSYALYPHMTVAENLGFSLSVRKIDDAEIEARVGDVAARLGLTELLDRKSGQLSGGQRQRVAVGRAIVREPRAFLFDEPLSNLDAALRGDMRIELKKLHHDLARTMIYVTHDQVEAMTLADRIVVLHEGHVQQVGPPTVLFERPANKFVAGFIGSPPMNFMSGQFRKEEGMVSGAGFEFPLPDNYRDVDHPAGDVIVGVRPSSLSVDEGVGRFHATVEVIEPLGWESYVHLDISGRDAVAQLPTHDAKTLAPGDTVDLCAPSDEVHIFDAATEEAIRPEDARA